MSPTPMQPPGPGIPPGPAQQQQYDYSQYTGEASQQVAQTSYGMKDGAGGADIFIPDVIGDFPKYETKSIGLMVFDIIMGPAGDKHPMVVNGRIRPDALVHTCWAYIHKNLAGNQWRICPARTYGKRCPACEERSRIMAMPNLTDEQVKKAIEPYASGKHPMGMYNIINHTTLQPQFLPTWQEPVQWWSITNAYMEAILQGKAKSDGVMEGTGYINYFWPTAGPQGGRHIKVDVVQDGKYFKFQGHMFYQRQQPIPPHVLSQARALSDFLYIGDDWDSYYDEIKALVDIVVESQANAEAGAGAPTGEATYAGPSMGASPEVAAQGPSYGPVFGTPPLQQGQFPECTPAGGKFGDKFGAFNECNGCNFYNVCQQANQPMGQAPAPAMPAPGPGPMAPQPTAPSPSPAPAMGAPAPGPAPAPPPGGPVPRRQVI